MSKSVNHDTYDDNYIRGILSSVKSIAMVGASPVDVRPSYFAFKYLVQRGYDMIPVNPGHVGKSLLGRPFVASLSDIGRAIDMVDIFRNSSHIMPVVEEALKLPSPPKVIWMQLGARDDAAAAKAEAAGDQGGDEPLPQDRVGTAVVRDFLDGRQFAHHLVEARADPDAGHAAVAEPDQRRRRRDDRGRPRREEQDRAILTRARNEYVERAAAAKHIRLGACCALTAIGPDAIVPPPPAPRP